MNRPPKPLLTRSDLLAIPEVQPTLRVSYGDHDDQCIDVYLPDPAYAEHGPVPVAFLVHGGCWRSGVSHTYFGQFARALAEHGVASMNVEYRRLGQGGGFPETFEDVAMAADMLAEIAAEAELGVPLDPDRVVAVGHSAGGHLALWLAARGHLPKEAPGANERPQRFVGVLALAGIPDLALAHEQGICGGAVAELLGSDPADAGSVLAWTSPVELPPIDIPQVHLVGEFDTAVPPDYVERCVEQMRSRGWDARMKILTGCGHMEPVVAGSAPWADVLAEIETLLATRNPGNKPTAPA